MPLDLIEVKYEVTCDCAKCRIGAPVSETITLYGYEAQMLHEAFAERSIDPKKWVRRETLGPLNSNRYVYYVVGHAPEAPKEVADVD